MYNAKTYVRHLIGQQMTKQFQVYLKPTGSLVTYSCVHCRAHLADHNDLISKSFQGSQGRAYLFDKVRSLSMKLLTYGINLFNETFYLVKVVNVKSANAEDRLLLTGQHRVADLHCACCKSLLGWKYERAFEPSQRYKEGKFIIELAHLIKENRWDEPQPQFQPSSPSSGYQSGDATSPPCDGGQRNDAFAIDSSGDEEGPSRQPMDVISTDSGGTLRRTVENATPPDLTYQQSNPQPDLGVIELSDLPLVRFGSLAHRH